MRFLKKIFLMGHKNNLQIINKAIKDLTIKLGNNKKKLKKITNQVIHNENNFNNEEEEILFELIAIHCFSIANAAKQLGLSKRQAKKKYNSITKRIVKNLQNMGFLDMETLK